MRLSTATVVYATIFATVCIVSEVFSSDLYCFSCFGYDKDDPTKCKERAGGNLQVRKCTTNSSELPACIKYSASYRVPQMMGGKLIAPDTPIHALHCGTLRGCYRQECPNNWKSDVKDQNCKISCCTQSQFPTCTFPVPNQDEINRYNAKEAKESGKLGIAVAGQRSSDAARIGWPVWLQAVSFSIFGWFKL